MKIPPKPVHFRRITDIYESEEMEYANDYLDAILESSHDGIYITDGNANTLRANKSYEEISGLNRDEVLGKNMRDLVAGGMISISGSVHALETRRPFATEQVFSTNKRAFITSTPIFDENDNIVLVVTTVKDITELHSIKKELKKKEALNRKYHKELENLKREFTVGADIVSADKNMISVLRLANRVALVDTPITVQGNAGTGKETLARYIHSRSDRADKPFVKVNMSSIPEKTLDIALFGHGNEGTDGHIKGLLDSADGGTVYFDEVFALPLETQGKLLNLAQNGILTPEGGTPRKANIRIIAGSRRNISDMERSFEVNKEWYYLLSMFTLRIPPLCERKDDIIPLMDTFLEEFNQKYHKNKKFDAVVYARLLIYPWPGNVRELKNLVQRAVIISENDVIGVDDLFTDDAGSFAAGKMTNFPDMVDLKAEVEKLEAEYMTMAFEKHKNTRAAAKNLGMDSSTFVRKRMAYVEKGLMQKYSK